jgi:hypothetical protein
MLGQSLPEHAASALRQRRHQLGARLSSPSEARPLAIGRHDLQHNGYATRLPLGPKIPAKSGDAETPALPRKDRLHVLLHGR